MLVILNKYFNGGVNRHFPDMTGKIVIITGANTGIGFETLREMAKLNPKKIILACRNKERGTKALVKVQKELNVNNLELMMLDLNDLNSVKQFADKFK